MPFWYLVSTSELVICPGGEGTLLNSAQNQRASILIGVLSFLLLLLVSLFVLVQVEKKDVMSFYSQNSEGLTKMMGQELNEEDFLLPFSLKRQHIFYSGMNDMWKSLNVRRVKIWNAKGEIIYSDSPFLIGQRFDTDENFRNTLNGQKRVTIEKLEADQKAFVKTMTPIASQSGVIIGVAEFYFDVNGLYGTLIRNSREIIPILIMLLIIVPAALWRIFSFTRQEHHKQSFTIEKYSQLYSRSTDGILLLDREKRIIGMNPAAERISGWKQGEIAKDLTCENLFHCSHESGRTIRDANCPLKTKCNAIDENAYSEFQIRQKDGSNRMVSACYYMIEPQPDAPIVVMQMRDITKQADGLTDVDILQELIATPHQLRDDQRIYSVLDKACKKIFGAKQLYLVLGEQSYSPLVNSETASKLDTFAIEIKTKRLGIEQEWKEGQLLYGVPLHIGTQVVGAMVVVLPSSILFRLEVKQKLSLLAVQTAVIYQLNSLLEFNMERRIEMETLYKLSAAIRSTQAESGIDYHVIEEVKNVTHADAAGVLLYDQHQNLKWNCCSGSNCYVKDDVLAENAIIESLQYGTFTTIDNSNSDEGFIFGKEGIVSIAVSPIVYRDTVYGVLVLGVKTQKQWNEYEKYLIQNISGIISVQIQNNQLYRKVENKAILLERERISREIHDGLAQAIGYVNIQLHRISKMLEEGKIDQALHEVSVVKEVIAQSYGEIRETITNLRIDQSNPSFINWLEDYIQDFRRITGLQVQWKLEEEIPPISEEARIQLIRVVQEAFSNVKKHSGASQVYVELKNVCGHLGVMISDNGRGFDQIPQNNRYLGGYGINIMKERIESVSGTFALNSQSNKGTTITVTI